MSFARKVVISIALTTMHRHLTQLDWNIINNADCDKQQLPKDSIAYSDRSYLYHDWQSNSLGINKAALIMFATPIDADLSFKTRIWSDHFVHNKSDRTTFCPIQDKPTCATNKEPTINWVTVGMRFGLSCRGGCCRPLLDKSSKLNFEFLCLCVCVCV